MKRSYSLILAATLGLASVSIYAQTGSVAGKWSGELSAAQGRGAAQPITVELKLEADMLSGTVTEGALGSRPIANAAVEGSTFSFRTTQNFGGQDIVVNWFGEVKGDELALTRGVGPTVEAPGGGGGGGGGRGGGAAGGAAGAAGGAAQAGGAAGGRGGGAAAGAPPAAGAAGGGRGGAAGAAGAGRGAAAGAQAGADPLTAGAAGAAGAAGGRGAAGAAAGAAGAAQGGRGGGGAAGGRGGGGGGAGAGGRGGGGAAAAAGVTRVNGGITLTLRRAG